VNREPQTQLIAWTNFNPPADVAWQTDAEGGPALAEFAGRACYQSWDKPNPATATNAGYLQHILEVGHYSVLEHGTATFYLTGVSRSFTHELVRHRHLSYSQLSQRYATDEGVFVVPAPIADDPYLLRVFDDAISAAKLAYGELLHGLERDSRGKGTAARKAARQAARAVLPNATETKIVVTGNYRAWRHFIDLRATEHADVEIRAIAVAVLRKLRRHAPGVFGDYEIASLPDGTYAASSPSAGRS
jgi:thymidylate synthase (FAD)